MATRLMRYDFSGYGGTWPNPYVGTPDEDETICPGPGYPWRSFGTGGGAFSWDSHVSGRWICPGTVDRPAPPGTSYYLHHQYNSYRSVEYPGVGDPYLSDDPPEPEGTRRVGGDLAFNARMGDAASYFIYPIDDPHDAENKPNRLALATARTSEFLFFRFKFRTTDDWSATAEGMDSSGNIILLPDGHKFIRVGTPTISGGRGPIIYLMHQRYPDGQVGHYDPSDLITDVFYAGHRLTDGAWHTVCMMVEDVEGEGSVSGRTWLWIDDWNCGSTPLINGAEYIYSDKSRVTGTTTSANANQLIDSGASFTTSVSVGYGVYNASSTARATVTQVNSNTTLTLDSDIMGSGQGYSAYAKFQTIYPCNNWSAVYPIQLTGLDIGGPIEVWDGSPTTEELSAQETTTSSSTTTAAPLYHDAPNQLFSNSTAAGAQSGKTRPKLTDRTPALSGLVYPGSGGQIEDVQIQVSTDKKFHRVNKWDSGWRALTTPIDTRGDRTPDIEYGSD